jgi:hypothetical protein
LAAFTINIAESNFRHTQAQMLTACYCEKSCLIRHALGVV